MSAPAPAWRGARIAWTTVLAGMLLSCILYRVVIAFLPLAAVPAHASPPRTVLYVAAAAALLASIAWTRRRLEPPPGAGEAALLPPLAQFMTASLVAMALAELSPVLGLVLVLTGAGSPAEYLAFGAGGFLVLALVILPRGLRYWSAWEATEGAGGTGS